MSEAINALVYIDRELGVISRYETAEGVARKTHTATEPDKDQLPSDINWKGAYAFRLKPPPEFAVSTEAAPMPIPPRPPGSGLATDWQPPESA